MWDVYRHHQGRGLAQSSPGALGPCGPEVSGAFSWARFFQDQGKQAAEIAQVRADLKAVNAKLDAIAKEQSETKVLVGSVRGGYKTIAWTAAVVGALATLAARWWVALHAGV